MEGNHIRLVKKKAAIILIAAFLAVAGLLALYFTRSRTEPHVLSPSAIKIGGKIYSAAGEAMSFEISLDDLEKIGEVRSLFDDTRRLLTENDPEFSCNWGLKPGDPIYRVDSKTVIVHSSYGLPRYEAR